MIVINNTYNDDSGNTLHLTLFMHKINKISYILFCGVNCNDFDRIFIWFPKIIYQLFNLSCFEKNKKNICQCE